MRNDLDEVKWTAYALGELAAGERAAAEAALRASSEARQAVEETREVAELLREAFEAEEIVGLSDRQRSFILRESPTSRARMVSGALLAAAAVTLALLLPIWVRQEKSPGRVPSTARREAPRTHPTDPISPPSETARTKAIGPSTRPPGPPAPPERTEIPVAAAPLPLEPVRPLPELPLPAPALWPLASLPLPPPPVGGVIRGTVVDRTGGVIPGARVSIRDTATAELREVTTDETGNYEASGLPGRDVEVAFELPGFKTHRSSVSLEQGKPRRLDVTLEVGSLAETVTVTSSAYGMQTASASVRSERRGELRRDRPRATLRRFNTETYDRIVDNPFIRVKDDPRATFSIDVDTASYSNLRRFLARGQMPPKDAVRIEEMLNYFDYAYAGPTDSHPIAIRTDAAPAPWAPGHTLVRIALKAREVELASRPSSNLVFLIDVSGSMEPPNKLPLLKSAMRLLVDKLDARDRVAIVVYAGSSGLVLPSTSGAEQEEIRAALDRLEAGGSTHGSAGIQLAYETARARFVEGGVNRVILATDGDFNVGVTNQGDLIRMIENEAKSGVFLSVLGFGMGNYKDSTLEKLADKGNGNYAYIDSMSEARKVLVEQMTGTLITVAKDVKLQVEFNPRQVAGYRLLGYENRVLRHEDFNDDAKDAGDVGAGHSVTALFELVPAGGAVPAASADPLKYQTERNPARAAERTELLTVKLRYKQPRDEKSRLLEAVLRPSKTSFPAADPDFRFAAAVASFGMLLRESPHAGTASYDQVLEIARASRDPDTRGYRSEFIRLVESARSLRRGDEQAAPAVPNDRRR